MNFSCQILLLVAHPPWLLDYLTPKCPKQNHICATELAKELSPRWQEDIADVVEAVVQVAGVLSRVRLVPVERKLGHPHHTDVRVVGMP